MAHCRSPSPSLGRSQSFSNSRTPDPGCDRRPLKHYQIMKENEKEPLCAADMVRPKSSPAASATVPATTKGVAKNFMSPTISASSKAVGPSPRRKILGERNHDVASVRSSVESIRSSVESVGSLAAVMLVKPAVNDGLNQGGTQRNHHNLGGLRSSVESFRSSVESFESLAEVTLPKTAMHEEQHQGGVQKVSGRQDEVIQERVRVDQGMNDPADPLTPADIAPLDADPALPPYDPETNFLSPRPRYLFYRPRPRQEIPQLDREDQLFDDDTLEKNREESADFLEKSEVPNPLDVSDSFEEDNKVAAENPGKATKNEEFDVHEESDVHVSKDAEAEKFDEVEADMSDKPEEEENIYVPDDPPFLAAACDNEDISSAPPSIQEHVNQSLFPELTEPHFVAPPPTKPRSFFIRPKVLSLVIITLILAGLTIPLSDTPAISSSFPSFDPYHSPTKVIENLSRAAEFADANLKKLARGLHQWSTNTYARFPYWESIKPKEEGAPVLPSNFTAALFNNEDVTFLRRDSAQEGITNDSMNSEYSLEVSEETKEQLGAEGDGNEDASVVESGLSDTVAEDEMRINSAYEHLKASVEEVIESKTIDAEVNEEAREFLGEGTTDFTSSSDGEHSSATFPGDTEFHPESPALVQDAGDSSDRLDTEEEVNEPPSSDTAVDFVSSLTEDRNKRQIVLAISSFVIALVTVLLSVYYIKQKQASSAAVAIAPSAAAGNRIVEKSPVPERLPEQVKFETTQVDSGPSEASSTVLMQQSAANLNPFSEIELSKRVNEENFDSQDPRGRRDSTASSTTTTSFGSFTTYEKVSGKKGKSKDEAMTPVRRSSRIRGQVTTTQES